MREVRRPLAFLAAVVLAGLMAGCGTGPAEPSPPERSSSPGTSDLPTSGATEAALGARFLRIIVANTSDLPCVLRTFPRPRS